MCSYMNDDYAAFFQSAPQSRLNFSSNMINFPDCRIDWLYSRVNHILVPWRVMVQWCKTILQSYSTCWNAG